MKKENLILVISVLSLILMSVIPYFSAASSQIPRMQVKRINEFYVSPPNLPLGNLFTYDHGVIIVFDCTYTVTSSNGTVTKARSIFYVYFVNTTIVRPLYTNISNTTGFNGFVSVFNKELYITVKMYSFRTGNFIGEKIFVFQGLKLVGEYDNSSACPTFHGGIELKKVNNVCIVELPDANITLVNSSVLLLHLLSKEVLIASVKQGQVVQKAIAVPINFTLYTFNGTIVWTKDYALSIPSWLYPVTESGFVPMGVVYNSIVYIGDQMFIANITTPLNTSSIHVMGGTIVNETILGLDLQDGEITTEIRLTNITAFGSLFKIGKQLYVVLMNEHNVTVEKYNGTALVKVVTEPVITENTAVAHAVLTDLDEVWNKFLLILNPYENGTNVTDIYTGGVLNYTLNESLQLEYRPGYTLLLYKGYNFTLVFLNDNGTVRGTLSLGNISLVGPSGLTKIPIFARSPCILRFRANSSVYYVAAEKPYNSSASKIVVYEVEFPTPETTTPTTSTVTSATTTSQPTTTTSTTTSATSTTTSSTTTSTVTSSTTTQTTTSTTSTTTTSSTSTTTTSTTSTTSVAVTTSSTSSTVIPTITPSSQTTTSSSPPLNTLIIGGIIVVAVIAGAVLFIRRK